MKTRALLTGLLALFLLAPAALKADDEREQLEALKERFKKRYPVLLDLKDIGKVGEVHDGFAAVVLDAYLEDHSEPLNPKSPTVRDFLAQENADRQKLYHLLAQRAGPEVTPEIYALRAGVRNFERAEPGHWLKPKDGEWVRKRDLKEPEEEGSGI